MTLNIIALSFLPRRNNTQRRHTAQSATKHKSEEKSLTKLHEKQKRLWIVGSSMNTPQQVKLITFNDDDEMWCTENLFSIFTLLNANKARLPETRLLFQAPTRFIMLKATIPVFVVVVDVMRSGKKLMEIFLVVLQVCRWGGTEKRQEKASKLERWLHFKFLFRWKWSEGQETFFLVFFFLFHNESSKRGRAAATMAQHKL